MRTPARQYRDTVYRLKSHPGERLPEGFTDSRDSMALVYWSTLPFAGLEYLTEASIDLALTGLVFPTGFLLFWAFYYTYYRPGLLENKLSQPGEFGLGAMATILFGVAIWFVKVSIVGLLEFAVGLFGFRLRRPRRSGTSPNVRRLSARPVQNDSRIRPEAPEAPARAAPRSPEPPLPVEVRLALRELGLETREWDAIQRRYRELAKKFHPDHNTNRHEAAKFFIRVDQAYRTLARNRQQYFSKK